MTLRLFAFLMLGFVFLPACKSKPEISAIEMEASLGRTIFELNLALNGGEDEKAKSFVAEEAEPAFDDLIQGRRDKKYNLFMSNDGGKIDFIASQAVVQMHLFQGTYVGGKPQGNEVQVQSHIWKYGIGGWKWYGPASK